MTTRPLSHIALEIQREWYKPHYTAIPYLEALHTLRGIEDTYGCDSARGIVTRFLSNASTWQGEAARRIKLELKGMLK